MNNDNKTEELLKNNDFKALPKIDELVKAVVVAIEKGEIYLDIDGVFTGIVRGRELVDESGQYSNLSVGDEVVATLVEHENEKGLLELSFRSAGHQQAWNSLQEIKESGEVVEVKVLNANKGGLLVQYNRIQGFLPVSQLSSENYPRVEGGNKNRILEKLREFINQKIKVKLIDVDEKEEKMIVSEKDIFAGEHKKMISTLKIGQVVDGKITAVVDFGAFIEFEIPAAAKKIEGLVHISEIAWQRISHPRDILKNGEQVKAQIISIENNRISLSIKKLQQDPWEKAVEKYQVGSLVPGKVLKTDKFGAFVELDQDIHGLAHISELSNKPIESSDEVVKVGQSYNFKVLSVEPNEHRLGLSLKQGSNKEISKASKEETPEPKEKTEKQEDQPEDVKKNQTKTDK